MGIPVALHGFGGGGGASLNFKVVGGLTQPADPSENTIWVNTDVDITSYDFTPVEPEAPEGGMVWVLTGTSSTVAFNALKKNGIQIYPISAKQYVDGAWVAVTAKSYQDGEWADWCFYYFLAGEGLADGYTGFDNEYNSTDELLCAYAYMLNTVRADAVDSKETIDVTNYSKLTVHFYNVTIGGNNDNKNVTVHFQIVQNGTAASSVTLCSTTVKDTVAVSDKTITFDLSNITGEITMRVYGTSASTSYHSTAIVRMDSICFE